MVFQLALYSKVRTSVRAIYYGTVDTNIHTKFSSSFCLQISSHRRHRSIRSVIADDALIVPVTAMIGSEATTGRGKHI